MISTRYILFYIVCFTITIFINLKPINAEVVPHEPCKQKGEIYTIACDVDKVTVNPCPEVSTNKPCKLKHNNNVTISFSYTPGFNVATANSRAYWDKTFVDLPFLGMNTDACDFTTCPINSGTKKEYTYTLPITNKYPAGEYLVKWKLWNSEPEVNKMCCFKVRINITP